MRSIMALAGALTIAFSSSATPSNNDGRIVSSTVDNSEWATPGDLRVNLDNGHFSFSPSVWTSEPDIGQPRGEARSGTVAPAVLSELNALADSAQTEGLVDEQCATIHRSDRTTIIVSTGGKREVTLSVGEHRETSHPDLECWTTSANALRDKLQDVINAERANGD